MPTIGGIEMLVIAVVAIVVVGPRDLPRMLRSGGQILAQLRGMAREFSNSLKDMGVESELEDMRRSIAAARNPMKALSDELDRSIDPTAGSGVRHKASEPAIKTEAPADAVAAEPAIAADEPAESSPVDAAPVTAPKKTPADTKSGDSHDRA